jgi:WD40 repeat protein
MNASPGQKLNDLVELAGAAHLWWRCCAEAAASCPQWLAEAYAALSQAITWADGCGESADPGIAHAVELLDAPVLSGPIAGARPETLLRAARSVAVVALSLSRAEAPTGPGEQSLTDVAVAHWGSVHALPGVSATSSAVPRPRAGLRDIAEALDQAPAGGLAAAMTGVQALLLSGAEPRPVHRGDVDVLFDATDGGLARAVGLAGDADPGVLGTLSVSVLPEGPPGLFPDPRVMGFFEGDEDFADALKNAWSYATRGGGARCVLWSVVASVSQEPCLRIKGASLGAAFAIAVSAAIGRSPALTGRLPAVPLRVMKTGCAVTGEVSGDGRLRKVGGMQGKVEALRNKKEFLVIAPLENQGEAASLRPPKEVTFGWARDVRQARRLTRRLSPLRVAIAATAVLALVIACVIPLYLITTSQQDQRLRAEAAGQLDTAASQLNVSNPQLAMLLALQANAQDPSDRTRNGLLSTLASDGSLVRTLHGHTAAVVDIGISSVGGTEFAVTGGFDGTLRVWDLATGKCTDVVSGAEGGDIGAIAFDPVLPGLVLAAGPHAATLWTLTPAGQLTDPVFPWAAVPAAGVISAAFSPDGVRLALGYQDGSVVVVNPASSSVAATTRPWSAANQTPAPVASVTFGPDDQTVYAGDDNDSGGGKGAGNVYQVQLTGVGQSTVTLLPTGQYGGIASLSYVKRTVAPSALMIGTTEGVLAWDPVARKQLAPFPLAGINAPVSFIKSNIDITAVGTTSGVTVIQNSELTSSGTVPGVEGVGLDDSSTYLLSAASDGDVYQWGLSSEAFTVGDMSYDSAAATAFAPDGSLIAVTGNGELFRYPGQLPNGLDQGNVSYGFANVKMQQASVLAVARVSGQEIAAVGDWSRDGSGVALVNVKTGRILQAPQLTAATRQCGGVHALAFTPDGTRLIIACWSGGQVSAWDTATWRQVASASLAGQGILTLAVTADGSTVVAGTSPSTPGSDNQPQAVWFLRLPDLRLEGSPEAAHPGGVSAITSSGQRVYSGGWDGTIRSWTLDGHATGQEATVNGRIFGLAYDPQTGLLLASTDSGLVFYDPATMTAVSPVIEIGDPGDGQQSATSLTLSPDGRYLAGAAETPTIFTGTTEWAVTEAGWTGQMCAKSGGNLTPVEWASYGPPGATAVQVCPAGRSAGPESAPNARATSLADPALVTATGPARPLTHATCADLVSSSSARCGTFGNGYAWTITQSSQGKVQVTIYARQGSWWKPVLGSSPTDPAYEAAVVPFSTRPGDPAVALWQVTSGDGSGEDVSVIQDGQVVYEQADPIPAIQAQAGGLRIWSAVYQSTDAMCCPSGHTTALLVRDGQNWALQGTQAVPASTVPTMPLG